MDIYLDVDDVVADWMAYARVFFKRNFQVGERLPPTEWSRLKDDQRMYSKLELRVGAVELVDWCREYRDRTGAGLYFLTAIPRNNDMPWAVQDKVLWCQKYFPDIPMFLGPRSHEKADRCTPGDILIDDRTSNCEDWVEAGGRAHIYRDWDACKLWLEQELGQD